MVCRVCHDHDGNVPVLVYLYLAGQSDHEVAEYVSLVANGERRGEAVQ
ncbi:MAG TPA: hypothetical protein ACQGQH_02715 [Xylella sp.]